MIHDLGPMKPRVHPSCFVAESAHVIGSVVLEEDASVWFHTVLRGDNDVITIGRGANVQDGSVLHTDHAIPLTVGAGVTIGHQVMLHGCEIGEHTLVGIQSVVLNRARIGRHCLIGAGALVTEGKQIPDRSVVMGAPGKIVRSVTDAEVAMLEGSAAHYVDNARRYLREFTTR